MPLGSLLKIATIFAGGTVAIGTPIFLTSQNLNSQKSPQLQKKAVSINISGHENCKILAQSLDEQKVLVICEKDSGLEFLFVKNQSEPNEAQKIVSFQEFNLETNENYVLKFTVESSSNSLQETIMFSKSEAQNNRWLMLKNVNISTCKMNGSETEISCTDKEQTSTSGYVSHIDIKLVTQ